MGIQRNVRIYNREGTEFGLTTGGEHRCKMESCWGWRFAVRWPNGRMTYPCERGMVIREGDGHRQIG